MRGSVCILKMLLAVLQKLETASVASKSVIVKEQNLLGEFTVMEMQCKVCKGG